MEVGPNDISIEEITPDDEELKNITKRKRLAPGWYVAVLANAAARISKKGHLMVVWEWFPLTDPDDETTLTTPAQPDLLCLPVTNPRFEGHQKPNTFGMCARKLRGIYGAEEVPYYPRRNKESGQYEYLGSVISEDELEDKRLEVGRRTVELALVLFKAPEELDGKIGYIKVGEEDDNGFVNVDDVRDSLPEDAVLVDPPFGVK